jgi:hypothetical protein
MSYQLLLCCLLLNQWFYWSCTHRAVLLFVLVNTFWKDMTLKWSTSWSSSIYTSVCKMSFKLGSWQTWEKARCNSELVPSLFLLLELNQSTIYVRSSSLFKYNLYTFYLCGWWLLRNQSRGKETDGLLTNLLNCTSSNWMGDCLFMMVKRAFSLLVHSHSKPKNLFWN